MPDTVTIRNGSARWDIRLEYLDELPLANWKAAMKHLARGGELNAQAIRDLNEWFPEAAQAACAELKEARETFERLYRDPKTEPRGTRMIRYSVNAELRRAVRQAQNKYDKLAARHHEFLAAKAQMKKEN